MSIRWMQLVWDSSLPPTRKLVMLSLADQANDAGECFPSIDTILRRTSLSKRAVFDTLRELEDWDCLDRESSPGCRGVRFKLHHPCTWRAGAPGASVRQAQDCASCTGAADAPSGAPNASTGAASAQTGAPGALPLKQPKANHQLTTTQPSASGREDLGGGNRDFTVDADGLATQVAEVRESAEFRSVVCYVDATAKLDHDLLAEFLIHTRSKRGVSQSIVWLRNLSQSINALASAGHDVNEAIRQTIGAGNLTRLIEPKARDGPGPRKPGGGRVSEDYEGLDYR